MPNAAEIRSNVLAECFNVGKVRGTVVRPHIDWVRDHGDRGEVIEFFSEIPPALRVVSVQSWYSFEDLIALDRLIVRRFLKGESRSIAEVGRYAARLRFGAIQRMLDRSGIQDFLRQSAAVHHQQHDFGNALYCELGDAEGQIIRTDWTSFSPLYCEMTVGFYREAIRLHGGVDVEVWESRCQCRGDESCMFELVWS